MKSVETNTESFLSRRLNLFLCMISIVLLFPCFLASGKILAVTPVTPVAPSGCSGFNSALTNMTLDSCTGTLCFTAQLDAQGMHGTCNWQVDYGDGSTYNTSTGGSGSVSITLHLCHTYSTAGTFVMTMSITPAHTTCIDQYTITIPIHGASFSGNNVCLNGSTIFTATSIIPVSSWLWNFGDGTTSTLQNPPHTFTLPGTYNITLIAFSTCNDTLHEVVVVNPIPVANFSFIDTCFGNTTCFTNLSTIATGSVAIWNWNFGDPSSGIADSSSLTSPCHNYTSAANYNISLTVISDSGCVSIQVIKPATSFPIPVAAFTDTKVCLHSISNFTDASITASGNPLTWNWNFGDGSPNSTQQNPSHTFTTAGTDTVTLIVTTSHGCRDTVAHPAIIYFNPVAIFSDSAKGCAPVCTIFNDLSTTQSGTITGWHWDFPGGTPSFSDDVPNPATCFNTPGTYDVSMIVTNSYGCKDTLLIPQYVNVYEWPVADFCVTPFQASIHSPVFNFCDMWTQDVTQWYWDFGDGSQGDIVNTDPVHSYSSTVTNNDFYYYDACLKVQTIHGCRDSICKPIEVLPEFTFFIANTFTPNGDKINDFFYGKGIGIKVYEIMIFDRWGNLIWTCNYEGKNTDWDSVGQEGMPSACKWDGRANGGADVAQIDVYVWKVKLTDIFNRKHSYIGIVNLVK